MYRGQTAEFHVPAITDNALRIIVLFTAAFIIESLSRLFFQADFRLLILRFDSGFGPHQFLTHIFTIGPNAPLGYIFHLLFEFIAIWLFGSDLERNWGRHNFLKFFLLGLLGGVLAGILTELGARSLGVVSLSGLVYYGFGGGLAAILVAYAMIWPDRKVMLFFIIPIRIKWLILLLFVMLFIYGFPAQFIMESGGALAGASFVYYYARRGRASSGSTSASAAGYTSGSGSGGGGLAAGMAAGMGKGAVGSGGKLQDHLRQRRLRKKQAEIDRRIQDKNEVDRLLGKISRKGMNSLTRAEKKFLDRASKEF